MKKKNKKKKTKLLLTYILKKPQTKAKDIKSSQNNLLINNEPDQASHSSCLLEILSNYPKKINKNMHNSQ